MTDLVSFFLQLSIIGFSIINQVMHRYNYSSKMIKTKPDNNKTKVNRGVCNYRQMYLTF